MSKRTVGLFSFSEQDTLLVRSLLTLGEPLLKEKWELVPFTTAEVILADSTYLANPELAKANATIISVGTAINSTEKLYLRRPLRLSPLVTLLNTFSPTLVISDPQPILDNEPNKATTTNNDSGELFNWLWGRMHRNKSTKPSISMSHLSDSPPQLNLSAPLPRTFHNPLVELNENQIRKNLSQLPLLNINFSIPYLVEALQGLSDEPLAPRARLQLLDLYRESINALFHSLGTTVVRKTLSTGGLAKTAFDPGRMFLVCAEGYKAIILACLVEPPSIIIDEVLLISLWRALEQLSHALVHAYRYYQSLPLGPFLETHHIFRYAIYWGRTSHLIRCTYPGLNANATVGPTSILELYKQLLLFSLSDPYSLSADHFNQVLEHIIPLAGKIQLLHWSDALQRKVISESVPDLTKLEGLFIVDLDADAPPYQMARGEYPGEIENRWVIDTQPLLKVFYQSTQDHVAEIGGLRCLAEQLITCLRGANKRSESRHAEKLTATLALGILTVHQALSGKPLPVLRIEENCWTVVNQSSKGLMVNSLKLHTTNVGDLVGVRSFNSADIGEWTLGVIRWLRSSSSGGIELGIELLSGNPTAVWCVYPTEEPQIGILQNLPEKDEALITPKGFYQRGQNFELHHQDRLRWVIASHLIQEEASFDLFELISSRTDI